MSLRGRQPVASTAPRGAPIALTGPGPVNLLNAQGVRAAGIPGGGVVLGAAIGRELQGQTEQEADRVIYTTAHTRGLYYGGEMRSPQQFVKFNQGTDRDPSNIQQTATTIRMSRRALNRNRGLAPGYGWRE